MIFQVRVAVLIDVLWLTLIGIGGKELTETALSELEDAFGTVVNYEDIK